MTPVSIGQLALYNPQRISDELAEKLFIIRRRIFSLLMKKISDEKNNSIPQHHIIIGLRGMGKSTLLKRIEVELRSEKYRDKFVPLLPPEEQYNISNLGEFWLNSLDALANTLELENNKKITTQIDNEIKKLESIREPEKAARETFNFFKSISKELGRRPVLLIDNLNLIFDRFSKPEQHTLRAWLMQNGAPILIGASAITIDDTLNYDAPFYDAFQQHYIKKLTFGESMKILTHLAKITNSEEMLPEMNKKSGRLRTIHHLTGGNPRTAVLLFRFIAKGFSPELKDDLDAMLDEITPLYKHRFESLSLAQQKILDAIALHWDPISLPDLRQATRLENNQLSPQLKRLYESGWVDKLNAYQTKGHAYQMSERFFNIWFLMRRSSRRQKRALMSLSKFLECFYGEKLSELAKSRITSESLHADDITLNLAMADALADHSIAQQLREKSYLDIEKLGEKNPDILELFDLPNRELKEQNLISEINIALERKDFSKVENKLDELNSSSKTQQHCNEIWHSLAHLYEKNKEFEKAENAFKKSINLNKKGDTAWKCLGDLYHDKLKQYNKAEDAYHKAIQVDQNDVAIGWYKLGRLYRNSLGKYEAAEEAYLKAIQVDHKYAYPFTGLGNLYQFEFDRYEEAERAYLKAIQIDEKYATPWIRLGNLYHYKLDRFNEAEEAYRKAIQINEKDAYIWNSLGNLYQYELGQFKEAERAYLKATQIDEKYTYAWYSLGNLYQDKLDRYVEAEEAYLKASQIDENHVYTMNSLGNLYQYKLDRYVEAEEAYLKASQIDEKIISWNSLGNLYQDYLKKYDRAKEAYSKAIENDDTSASYNLVFLYRDKLNKNKKAKEVFKKIIFDQDIADSHFLNEALFSLYDKNAGIAQAFLQKAFDKIDGKLPSNTEDDWIRFACVVRKLHYTDWLLEVMEETGQDIELSPYYTAIKALNEKDTEGYLLSRAVEIREPAIQIIEMIKRFK